MRIVGSSNRQKQNSKFKTSIKSVRKYSFWYVYLRKTMPRCKIEKKRKGLLARATLLLHNLNDLPKGHQNLVPCIFKQSLGLSVFRKIIHGLTLLPLEEVVVRLCEYLAQCA